MNQVQRELARRKKHGLVLVNKQINQKYNHHHHSSSDHHNHGADRTGNQTADSRVIKFDRIFSPTILPIVHVHQTKLLCLVLNITDNDDKPQPVPCLLKKDLPEAKTTTQHAPAAGLVCLRQIRTVLFPMSLLNVAYLFKLVLMTIKHLSLFAI